MYLPESPRFLLAFGPLLWKNSAQRSVKKRGQYLLARVYIVNEICLEKSFELTGTIECAASATTQSQCAQNNSAFNIIA